MATKATIFALRFIVIFMFLRVGVTAVESGSLFLFMVTIVLAIIFLKMPKLVKS